MKKNENGGCLGKHFVGRKTSGNGKIFARDCRDENGDCSIFPIGRKMTDDEFEKYVFGLEYDTRKMLKSGLVDFEPAKIGFNPYTGSIAWDYDMLIDVLFASGHCERCARDYVQLMAEQTDENDNAVNLMITKKERMALDFAEIMREKRRTS